MRFSPYNPHSLCNITCLTIHPLTLQGEKSAKIKTQYFYRFLH